ncbi:MAG: UDP-N-acetylmuramate--L-alanine ligase [Treponema sp.]|jgi:UDP-N-acetylmuramate--alanine ligase|nr:UDP-N-acetylmuramate--L-alanine ligase [Treponema sp.]
MGITPSSVYFVGIKGTGVCALAELMHNSGIKCRGSDTPEIFYTDKILKELNIPYYENFDASRIDSSFDMVIHSAAYSPDSNPELAQAVKLNIPVLKYTDALGEWSRRFDSAGICGVHGKTTTTAICGVMMRAAGIPAQILAGSAVLDFNGRSTLNLGEKYFIAETCEYRRHFLSFHPKRIILTAVESDHQDCFPDYESIRGAFAEYCRLLPEGGQLIYCADDAGASEVARIMEGEKRGIRLVPYGFTAEGGYKIVSYNVENERAVFEIAGFPGVFKMRIPGRHEALNAAAALALVSLLSEIENNGSSAGGNSPNENQIQSIKNALENFKSTKRRSEIIGEAGGVLFMDDYGHHPTAINSTLGGIKSFYPERRLIVSFMSHTYTRTSALLEEFASCFGGADVIFFHKIYASARENYRGGVNGRTLYEKTAAINSGKTVNYIEEPDDAYQPLCEMLKPGDIFLTLGAGNNWPLCEKLFTHFKAIGEKHGVSS